MNRNHHRTKTRTLALLAPLLAFALGGCGTLIAASGPDRYESEQIKITGIDVDGIPGDRESMLVGFEAMVETLWSCNEVEVSRAGAAVTLVFKRRYFEDAPGRVDAIRFDVTGVDTVSIRGGGGEAVIWRRSTDQR